MVDELWTASFLILATGLTPRPAPSLFKNFVRDVHTALVPRGDAHAHAQLQVYDYADYPPVGD